MPATNDFQLRPGTDISISFSQHKNQRQHSWQTGHHWIESDFSAERLTRYTADTLKPPTE